MQRYLGDADYHSPRLRAASAHRILRADLVRSRLQPAMTRRALAGAPAHGARAFLTAEWRNLVMLNYEVESSLLDPLVPLGTELDSWQGRTFISLVGFLFANTRVLGMSVPLHRTFEEVNLRFYVRRTVAGEVRRAVTFIRELVPRASIALVARLVYNEPYLALPMRHRYGPARSADVPSTVEYGWKTAAGWSGMRGEVVGRGARAAPGSQEEFITEHYWGYTRQRDGTTIEYRVAHPPWRVWTIAAPEVTGDLAAVYGPAFARALAGRPTSVFLADGSAVVVHAPLRLE
jgi:uncharacterized protein YqjF (DUF2071 family)